MLLTKDRRKNWAKPKTKQHDLMGFAGGGIGQLRKYKKNSECYELSFLLRTKESIKDKSKS